MPGSGDGCLTNMNTENTGIPPYRPSLLRNWMSLTGLVVVIGSLFSFCMLLMLDAVSHFSNPYISILTWMVTPGFLISGMVLTLIGALRARHRRVGSASMVSAVQIDLSRPRDRRTRGRDGPHAQAAGRAPARDALRAARPLDHDAG